MELEMVYKAVVLRDMLENELNDWKEQLQSYKKSITGLISEGFIQKTIIITSIISSLVLMLINFIVAGMDYKVFFFLNLHSVYGGLLAVAIGTSLMGYNFLIKKLNANKLDSNKDYVNCQEQIKATKKNVQTINQKLSEQSTVAFVYQKQSILETMIMLIREGRVRNADEAINVIRKDFPQLLETA